MTVQPWPPPVSPPPQESPRGRLRSGLLLIAFTGILLLAVGLIAGVVATLTPDDPVADCPSPPAPCAPPDVPDRPPTDAPTAAPTEQPTSTPEPGAPLRHYGTPWRSEADGWLIEYWDDRWDVVDEAPDELVLERTDGVVLVSIASAPAGEASPQDLLDRRVDELSDDLLGFDAVTDPDDLFLGEPGVAGRDGVGGLFVGSGDAPQGPSGAVDAAVLAATDGEISVVFSALVDRGSRESGLYWADWLLNTFRWPTDPQ